MSSPHPLSYGLYALESWVHGTPLLTECLEVTLDGKVVELPSDLRTLVFLNFTCYQGGMDVWGPLKDTDPFKPSMADGKLEVVGLGGLWHEMRARTEVSHGHRIGQVAKAEIRVLKPVAIAMSHDGEVMFFFFFFFPPTSHSHNNHHSPSLKNLLLLKSLAGAQSMFWFIQIMKQKRRNVVSS